MEPGFARAGYGRKIPALQHGADSNSRLPRFGSIRCRGSSAHGQRHHASFKENASHASMQHANFGGSALPPLHGHGNAESKQSCERSSHRMTPVRRPLLFVPIQSHLVLLRRLLLGHEHSGHILETLASCAECATKCGFVRRKSLRINLRARSSVG